MGQSELERLRQEREKVEELLAQLRGVQKDIRAAVREAREEIPRLIRDQLLSHIKLHIEQVFEVIDSNASRAIKEGNENLIKHVDKLAERLLGDVHNLKIDEYSRPEQKAYRYIQDLSAYRNLMVLHQLTGGDVDYEPHEFTVEIEIGLAKLGYPPVFPQKKK